MRARTVALCRCGFKRGDRVTMISAFTKTDGSAPDRVYGVVEDWDAGCGHIVQWDDSLTATALPNPNVQMDGGAS